MILDSRAWVSVYFMGKQETRLAAPLFYENKTTKQGIRSGHGIRVRAGFEPGSKVAAPGSGSPAAGNPEVLRKETLIIMEEILKESAKQVPNLAVLGFIVWIFVKHLDRRGQLFSETTQEMHKDHLAAREEMIKVIGNNANALHELSKAVATCPTKTPPSQNDRFSR